ncbi:hypothetical protein BC830DRAFT_344904 [Chytriomyces sp. MP71]|nr:hypothetical protein BC830DRAFT_344904 [Chytriomyces sp. MP71]
MNANTLGRTNPPSQTKIPSYAISAACESVSEMLRTRLPVLGGNLESKVHNLRESLLNGVNLAAQNISSGLSCSGFARSTVVFEDAVCASFLDSVDSLYTSCCFAGLGSAFLVWLYPLVVDGAERKKLAKTVSDSTLVESEEEIQRQLKLDDEELPTPPSYSPLMGSSFNSRPLTRDANGLTSRPVTRGAPQQPDFHVTLPNTSNDFSE